MRRLHKHIFRFLGFAPIRLCWKTALDSDVCSPFFENTVQEHADLTFRREWLPSALEEIPFLHTCLRGTRSICRLSQITSPTLSVGDLLIAWNRRRLFPRCRECFVYMEHSS